MEELTFLAGTFAIFAINGLPFVLFSDKSLSYRAVLPAPIFGAAFLSVLATILYSHGIEPRLTILASSAGAFLISMLGLYLRPHYLFHRTDTKTAEWVLRGACFVAVTVTILLPHWIGGNQFSIFQGNRHDNINYLTNAFAYANYPFSFLKTFASAPSEPIAGLLSAGQQLTERPTVGILYASLYKILSPDYLRNSYEFCLACQLNLYCAFLYLAITLYAWHDRAAHLISAAFAVGFFSQYLLDINAWSELIAVPMVIILLVDYCRMMLLLLPVRRPAGAKPDMHAADAAREPSGLRSRQCGWAVLRISVLGAGIAFSYPEIGTVTAFACGTAFVLTFVSVVRRSGFRAGVPIVAYTGVVGLMVLLVASLFWDGTLGFVVGKLRFAASASVSWHLHFQAYLLGHDPPSIADLLRAFGMPAVSATAPANFILGFFGLYFLEPWNAPALLAVPYLLGITTISATLLVSTSAAAIMELKRVYKEDLFACLVLASASVTFLVPLGLLIDGQYWAAGKALSMVFGFAFLIISLPLMAPSPPLLAKRLAWLVVAGHLLFGIYRPMAVAQNGDELHYGFPYPEIGGPAKTSVDWDIARYQRKLGQCHLVMVDIDEPFLERVVENYLMEEALRWSSPRPQNAYYGAGANLGPVTAPIGETEDCAVLTIVDPATDWHRLSLERTVWLRKNDATFDFMFGSLARLALCCQSLPGIPIEGSYGPEAGGAFSWTNGRLLIELPSPRLAPIRHLRIKFAGVSVSRNTSYTLYLNGTSVRQGFAGESSGDIDIMLPVRPDGPGTTTIYLVSETFSPDNDPRELGLQIESMTLLK
jgi:hypothetical protein